MNYANIIYMDKFSLAFSVSNLGPKTFQRILNKFGSAENGWFGSVKEYAEINVVLKTYKSFDAFRTSFDIDSYITKLKKEKIEFIAFTDKRYPKSLKKIEDPPIGLFCKGNVKLLKPGFAIGVVGTRRITQYGRDATNILVEDLVKNGTVIVSGLALGVDGQAHHVTLENHGLAIAVLACGVDCCTPSENYSLYTEILKQNGLIISEYPLSQPPNKGTFLARNRIVAAISDGLLITEAAEGSGSLVTAEFALQYDKQVFAVPGQITSRMSDGSLRLLKKGATLATNANDILEKFQIQNRKFQTKSKFQNLKLSKEEKRIAALIEDEGLTIDEITKTSGLPVSKVFVALSNLELQGFVKNNSGKFLLRY